MRRIIFSLVIIASVAFNKHRERVIDLPEEIQLARKGDTLKVYKVTKDTIYIGFANERNN